MLYRVGKRFECRGLLALLYFVGGGVGRHQLADMEGARTLEDAEALLSEVRTTTRLSIAARKQEDVCYFIT